MKFFFVFLVLCFCFDFLGFSWYLFIINWSQGRQVQQGPALHGRRFAVQGGGATVPATLPQGGGDCDPQKIGGKQLETVRNPVMMPTSSCTVLDVLVVLFVVVVVVVLHLTGVLRGAGLWIFAQDEATHQNPGQQ